MSAERARQARRRLVIQAGIGAVALLVAAAGIAILFEGQPAGKSAGQTATAEPRGRAPSVTTVAIERAPRTVMIAAWGVVEPSRTVGLSPRVGGRLREIAPVLSPGRRVAEGESVAQVDPADFEIAVRRAEADLAQARADLAMERGNQRVAAAEAASIEGVLSAEERDLVLRGPQMRAAEAAVVSAEAALDRARLDLARTEIASPFRGIVLSEDAAPGMELSAGEAIAEVAALDRFRIEVKVAAHDLRWVRAAGRDEISVVIDNPDVWAEGEARTASIDRVLPAVSETGRMARVLVDVPAPLARKPEVLIGSYLRARIVVPGPEDAALIPERALRSGDSVWVVTPDGRLEIRAVRVAYRGPDGVIVDAGLAEGDRVVVSRLDPVVDGMRVKVRADEGGEA